MSGTPSSAVTPRLLVPVLALPMMILTVPPRSLTALLHDAGISTLRSYSRSAFVELGRAADPAMNIEFVDVDHKGPIRMAVVVYSR
jgi:hypothetical protein